MNRHFKVEGDIIYPDHTFLTWGPFYYHSKEKAKIRMEEILLDITNWCNMKDPSLNICPQDIKRMGDQIVFDIQAWKDDTTLQKCDGIIEVEFFKFEDNILEVKEVDYAPIDNDFERDAVNFCFDNNLNTTPRIAKTIAKHFFELGLKAQV